MTLNNTYFGQFYMRIKTYFYYDITCSRTKNAANGNDTIA